MITVENVPNLDVLIDEASSRFIDTVTEIITSDTGGVHGDGIARVVFTGGGAGIKLLSRLVRAKNLDWSRIHVFFGDERNVPVYDPDSNEGQARYALLNHVNIPEPNIHGYRPGNLPLDDTAAYYSNAIQQHAPRGFDLHLLGMGPDGHINSLFPSSAALDEEEKLVVGVYDSPKPPAERITLTLPAVARAKEVWLLVSGSEKAEAISHLVDGEPSDEWPVTRVPALAETTLFVAEDAFSPAQ
ncbi:6-phosphogluconolactonase [Corynebacterium sp. p3-SID1145]|uniref:6-phosphogluconolactonase n=1 Tax=unclassified Corynebacterium TaxID=2624378 RepID=UPI0021AA7DF6|nr:MULTISPECIES: 6-phosphogluconolactonase [unclassified Corynebacterium]MCT1452397.1 6-phosphogluconolactonase [Corynebacterium sp. p3-SID1145]MCT1461207.1 6-phosphogluconolactonase [Corynebacterium sp. p3-SID1140]